MKDLLPFDILSLVIRREDLVGPSIALILIGL